MSHLENTWRFDSYFTKYELKIVEILGNITQIKGFNPKYGIILGWFFIHPQLTQNRLEELTGISKSTFLPVLKYLESIGFLKREYIPGTHINQYNACKTIQEYTHEMIIGLGILYNRYHSFLNKFLLECERILIPSEKEYLWKRIKDLDHELQVFLQQLVIFKQFIPKSSTFPSSIENNSESQNEKTNTFSEIEHQLIQFLTQYPLFPFPKTSLLKIFILFVIHLHLTQSEIQNITHYSVGTVSQDVKNLIRLGLIYEIHSDPDSNKPKRIKVYSLNPFREIMKIMLKNIMSARIQWKASLIQMKTELERRNNIKMKSGYSRIMNILDYMLSFYPIYERIIEFINKN